MITARFIANLHALSPMVLPALASIGLGLGSGFAFGTGYGAGVRFGYEDVYPYLKGNMADIAKMLNIPFASSGFKLASGVTERQGSLTGVDSIAKQGNLQTPESMTPQVSPSGTPQVKRYTIPRGSISEEFWHKANLGMSLMKDYEGHVEIDRNLVIVKMNGRDLRFDINSPRGKDILRALP